MHRGHIGMKEKEKIPLATMLGQLRQELLDARAAGEGSDLKFHIQDIELELQLGTTQEAAGGIGVKFWVYNADATVNASEVNTQRLKLKLKPKTTTGEDLEVSDQDDLGDLGE